MGIHIPDMFPTVVGAMGVVEVVEEVEVEVDVQIAETGEVLVGAHGRQSVVRL